MIYVFSFQPCSPVAPFGPLSVPREIGFTDDDRALPGFFLGEIAKDKNGAFSYSQCGVSHFVRLSAKNLRAIADRLDHLTNEEEKLKDKTSKKNRPTQSQRRQTKV